MKKLIYSFIFFLTLLSCSSIVTENKRILNTYSIKNMNEIENLTIKDKLDLTNGEINLYHIKELKTEGIPKIIVDINYEKGIIDSFIISKIDASKILLSLNNVGDNKTINKEIIFARLPKDSKLEFKLENEYQVIDNTIFEIKTIETDRYKWIKLVPFFLDEDTFERKAKEKIEKESNVAFYENNMIMEYEIEEKIGNRVYKKSEAKLGNGKIIKGFGEPQAEIIIYCDNFQVNIKVNENGRWESIIPEAYIGNLKIIQKNIVDNKTIFTEVNGYSVKRKGE
ncbi:hypothetical protein [Streptobacillus moniliformis]|uniref:Lipoprotein n=2 Tax=Streptobacillus moniliformis TaxID=34105 RepID=D1AYH7_STRM9|nr:hypothetical protein [Streptobacillus moniliformis]ACZ01353.1 hypothetical protein Smon_0886 [Streptobacillus moniliformis DSM 12112]SQA13488.1 Uncharacterised protein [Streptobacillus moniliformis]